MPNTHSTLTSLFSDIADAIRAKTGDSGAIVADEFPDAIAEISGGGGSQPQLNAPLISISQNTLNIGNPSTNGNFVSKYKIYVNGSFAAETVSTTYDLSQTGLLSATVYVTAAGTNFRDSPASNTASYQKYYTVNMYDGATLLKTEQIANGSMPTYTPTKSGYIFDYWNDSNGNRVTQITGDTDLYAEWVAVSIIKAGTYNIKAGTPKPSKSYIDIFFHTDVTFVTGSSTATKNAFLYTYYGSYRRLGFGTDDGHGAIQNPIYVALYQGSTLSIQYNGFTFAQDAEVTPEEYEDFIYFFERAT